MPDNWGQLVLAAGALGTAAFGIVEGLKWIAFVGEAGFPSMLRLLGEALQRALRAAYGEQFERMLRAQYRGDQENFASTNPAGQSPQMTQNQRSAVAFSADVLHGVSNPRYV